MNSIPRRSDNQAPRSRPQAPRSSARLFRSARRTLLDLAIRDLALTLFVAERAEACQQAGAGAACFCFEPLDGREACL